MSFPLIDHIILFIVATAANLLSSIAGGGAGLLQLPALIFLGLPFSIALATHKIATVALGLGATVKHSKTGYSEKTLLIIMLVSGIPGVILGANIILDVPEAVAKVSLGLLTIGLGVYSAFNKSLGQSAQTKHRYTRGYIIGAIGLFFLGVINGSLTSGTGLFVTMWLIMWFGLDYKSATAHTMLLVGLFWNGSGALTLAMISEVKWDWLPALIIGSLIGGYVGAHLAIKSGNPFIKKVFEAVTILVGISLISTVLLA